MRIAQVESAWEVVARGMVLQMRNALLTTANVVYTMGNQQGAAALANAAAQIVWDYRFRAMQSFESLASRSAALATRLLNGAFVPMRESVQDDIQKADSVAQDEFGQRLDELQQTGIVLFLVSQFQIAAMMRSIQIQGIPIESLYQDIGTTVYRKVYLQSASSLANEDDIRATINSMTDVRPGARGSLLPSIRDSLSTIVHGIGTGMMQFVTQANRQLFHGEIHSAIIDDVTCRTCRNLNGTYYPFENGKSTARPVPVHRSCRCNLVPITTVNESSGTGIPSSFDSWLRDNPDVAQELLGARKADFMSGKIFLRSFIDYRKSFHIPALTYEELRTLICQTSN